VELLHSRNRIMISTINNYLIYWMFIFGQTLSFNLSTAILQGSPSE
jgi:hypothetical protein